MPFRNRADAGRQLARRLVDYEAMAPVVVGLPRGGIPVAAEVAKALHAPLDVLVVRKIGVPWQPELGMGAVGEGGRRVLNDALIRRLRIPVEQIESVTARERTELDRRVRAYRGDRERITLRDRTVIIVDDGIATGYTIRAAAEIVRLEGAQRVVIAVPVGPVDAVAELGAVADAIVIVETPADFAAIGEWYDDFRATKDDEVIACLDEARA